MASRKKLARIVEDKKRANTGNVEHRFVLDADAFAEFEALCDRPAQVNPRLAALLSTPTVLDDD